MARPPLPNGPRPNCPESRRQCARDSLRAIASRAAAARGASWRPSRPALPRRRAGRALAHGSAVPDAPDAAAFLLGWSFDPLVWLPAIAAAARCGAPAVRRVNRGPPGEPGAAAADRSRGCWALVAIVLRAGLRDRALRHDAVLGPHGPAPAADAGRAAAARCSPARSRCCCGRRRRRPAGAGSCRCSTRGSSGSSRSRVVAWLAVRGGHVGQPLLAAVRRRARERVAAPPRARAVPGRGAPVLVAGRGPGPVAVADATRGQGPLRRSSRCPRTRSSRVAIYMATVAALPALRDDAAALGADAARGPADRRRDHVAGRRPDVPACADPARASPGCATRSGGPSARTGGWTARAGRDPGARGRGLARERSPRRPRRRPLIATTRSALASGAAARRAVDQPSGGIGASR